MKDRFRGLEHHRYDAVVVGAGAGGLTAAPLLARQGRSVLVLDQHYVAGRNAAVFHRYRAGASLRTLHGIAGVMMSGLMAAGSVLGMALVPNVMGPANAAIHAA